MKEEAIQDVILISKIYEGELEGRKGFNFPMAVARSFFKDKPSSPLAKYGNAADFVICYKKDDEISKNYERQHAKYFTDPVYREATKELWDSFSYDFRQKLKKLLNMNYDDDNEILLDEFQAYYFRENPNFFKPPRSYKNYIKNCTKNTYSAQPYSTPYHTHNNHNNNNNNHNNHTRKNYNSKNKK
jgi:hypothetical protein